MKLSPYNTPTYFSPKFRRRLSLRGFHNLDRSPVKDRMSVHTSFEAAVIIA